MREISSKIRLCTSLRKGYSEERQRQLKQIYLPTDKEVRTIYSEPQEEQHAEPARTLAGAGSILVSVLLSSLTVYQTNDPRLAFLFGACLCYLLTNRVIRFFKRWKI